MDGANLQQSKVVHFGPTLDKQTIKSIVNSTWNYYENSIWHKEIPDDGLISFESEEDRMKKHAIEQLEYLRYRHFIFEGNSYFCSKDDTLIVDKEKKENHDMFWVTESEIVSGNYLFVIVPCEGGYHYLKCFNIVAKKLIWERKAASDACSMVAFDGKVFYTDAGPLECLEAATGNTLFKISPVFGENDAKEEEQENPKKKTKWDIMSVGNQIAIDGDYAVWLISNTHLNERSERIAVANWKTQQFHGTYELGEEYEDYGFSRFVVANGVFYVNAIPGSDDKSYCIAIDLNISKQKSKMTKLWKFSISEASCDYGKPVSPCVYDGMVFNMFYVETAYIFALDSGSGSLLWLWEFYPERTYDVEQYTPIHLYVLEGTASIDERQKLRYAVAEGTITQFTMDDEEDGKKEEEKNIIEGNVEKRKDTTFPTLRFALYNDNGHYFEGAAITESGQLMYFKKETGRINNSTATVAISKHQKPEYLTMSV